MTNARLRNGLMLGAILTFSASAAELTNSQPVTFTKDIVPIFQEKCQDCHRPGTVAPMSLITYDQARPWAKSIKQRVVTRNMPPWHIDETVGIQKFKNDTPYSEDRDFEDCPLGRFRRADGGDAKDMPAARVWPAEDVWRLAKISALPT